MSELKRKTISSLKWSAFEKIFSQGIQLLSMLLLARILGPSSFGLMGMIAIFISIAQVFVDSGFSSALIRKVNRTETDYSSAFYLNISISILSYFVLFIAAPFIAEFYNKVELVSLIRWMSLAIIANGFIIVPRTKLTVDMDFKSQAQASIISVVGSGILAIILANMGYGVWALAIQSITLYILNAICLNLMIKWIPLLVFSKDSIVYLYNFGSKILFAGLIDAFYINLYQIVIGKNFEAQQVGLYTQSNQLSGIPARTLSNIIQRVTYPLFSTIQNDKNKLENYYLETMKMSSAIIFPLMAGLAAVAGPLCSIILGRSWSGISVLVSVLSIGYMIYPVHAINLNLLQVKGRSDLYLRLEIIKKILGIAILIITFRFGILAMCIGVMIHSYASLFINTYYTGRITTLTISKQVKELISIWLITLFCNGALYFISISILNNEIFRVLFLFIGVPISYISLMYIFQRELCKSIFNVLNLKRVH